METGPTDSNRNGTNGVSDPADTDPRDVVRGPISIGDAIRAIVHLGPTDDETTEAIHALLGIDREAVTLALPNVGAWKPSTNEAVAPNPVPSGITADTQPISDAPVIRPQRTVTTGIDAHLTRKGTGPPPPPDWADDEARMPMTARGPIPPPIPLFRPPRGRAILSTALATVVNEGDIDLDRIVERLAGGQMLSALPRLRSLTLRRGVQLLIDRSPGLDPFRADVESLVRSLDEILSDDRLDVSSFAGCPSRGIGTGPRQTWPRWTPKLPGTPVVVVTDLGIGGPAGHRDRATLSEWLRFARRVRESGSELIALVPYEANRWPPELSRAMTVIHWSERTSVGSVRRARHEANARTR